MDIPHRVGINPAFDAGMPLFEPVKLDEGFAAGNNDGASGLCRVGSVFKSHALAPAFRLSVSTGGPNRLSIGIVRTTP